MDTTISSRSRNLGLGWSNTPARNGGIAVASAPDVTGGLRSIEAEWQRARQLNSTNDWSASLFVGGRRVVAWWTLVYDGNDYEMGWASSVNINSILADLRDRSEVRVRTELA